MSRPVNPAATLIERSFVVFVLLLSTGAFLNLRQSQGSAEVDVGSLGMQVFWSLIYLVTFILLFKCPGRVCARLRNEFWLIMLVGFALCSTFWSSDPSLTARRGIALIGTTSFGIYLASRYSLNEQLRLLAVTFGIASITSIVFQLLGWGTALDVGVPGWIGIYVQKNSLGLSMALASAVFFVVRKCDVRNRAWATLGLILAFVLLVLSQSTTSVLLFIAIFLMVPASRYLRRSYQFVAIGFLAAVPLSIYGATWAFHNLGVITRLFGRDPTLTGRVQLWILSVVMALQRPWLGYGYNAFWRGWDGPSAAIWRLLSWHPPHSHNGFLEVWLGLGIVGLGLFLMTFLVYLRRAISFVRGLPTFESTWPLMFLTMLLISNLTEANILSRTSIMWILYVAVGITLGQRQQVTETAHSGEIGVKA